MTRLIFGQKSKKNRPWHKKKLLINIVSVQMI